MSAFDDLLADPGKHVTQGFHLERNLDRWLELSPLHRFPLPWGSYDPDPGGWEVFRPPFFGFNFRFEPLALNNFAVDWSLTLNPSLGDVGLSVFMDTQGDETDWDIAQGIGFSVVAVGFVPPRPGPRRSGRAGRCCGPPRPTARAPGPSPCRGSPASAG